MDWSESHREGGRSLRQQRIEDHEHLGVQKKNKESQQGAAIVNRRKNSGKLHPCPAADKETLDVYFLSFDKISYCCVFDNIPRLHEGRLSRC